MGLCFVPLFCFLLQCLCVGILAIDCAPASGTFEVKTENEVTDIKTCETFTGSIVIAASAPEVISLDGIRTIVSGNIDVQGASKLRALSSESLQSVSSFTLNNLPELATLNFPSLVNISSLKWFNLPTLQSSTIASGTLKGRIQELTVSNTSLRNLDWFRWPVQSQLNITGNAYLHTLSIPSTEIGQGSEYSISDNPSLEKLAFDKLKRTDGKLTIDGNLRIKSIAANALETINGEVIVDGSFTDINLTSLKDVKGSLLIASSENIEPDCKDLSTKPFANNVKCSYAPQGLTEHTPSGSNNPQPTSNATPTSSDDTDTANSGISTGMKVGLAFTAIALTIIICVGAFFYFRKRSRAKVREIDRSLSTKRVPSEIDSVELGPKELESGDIRRSTWQRSRQDLPAGMPYELDAMHGASELSVARPESVAVSPSGSMRSTRSTAPLIRHELP